jgi:selenide,water dikinase
VIDLEKRKRIMGRSIELGHCICNPKQPCPCEMLKEKNVCLCAGERLEDMPEEVPLTKLVENAGCASKINQNDLKKVLSGLPKIKDPRVLVSADTCDDAGVFKINDDLALVQSVDVFTPNVDDPYTFGQIAAANSLSDIYAMGGKPLTALSIVGFPIETLSYKLMNKMLKGGVDKMKEAGVMVIGGHSIKDNEVKFGFSVTGEVSPRKIITNDKAKPGDVLVLTKPIGTGIVGFAGQIDQASPSTLKAVSRSMTELNKAASEVMVEMGASAATDITGFGLAGHLSEIVVQSGVTAEVYFDLIPVFDGVFDLVRKGVVPGGIERNREYASQYVVAREGINEERQAVFFDPQTSGGLLISIDGKKGEELVSRLKERGIGQAAIIGKIVSKSKGKIILKPNSEE